MKNIKILAILILLLLTTGCVKYDLDMSLKSDKSITITLIDAIEKSYYSEDMYTSSFENYENLGFIVEKYSDEQYQGLKIKKNYESIDEISSIDCGTIELTTLLENTTNEYKIFNVKKEGTQNTYTANFIYDLKEESTTETTSEEIDYSQYSDSMVFRYTISLPKNVTILKENADEKTNDNYTLIWNMKYGEEKNISFSFIFDDKDVTEKIIEETTPEETKTEKKEEQPEMTEEINPQNKNRNASSYIMSFLLLATIIIIFIFTKKKNKNKDLEKDNQFYHKNPHNLKK